MSRYPKEPAAALKAIRAGQVAPVYLLYGAEGFLIEELLDALKARVSEPAFNYHLFENGELAEAVTVAQTNPFFSPWRLVVVRDLPLLAGKEEVDPEPLFRYLEQPAPFSTLVFTATAADGRRKVVKALGQAGAVIECKPYRPEEAAGWFQARLSSLGAKIPMRTATLVVERVGPDLRALAQEAEKLALYVGPGQEVTPAAVDQLVAQTAEASVFALVDALGTRAKGVALRHLGRMLSQGEPPLRLLALIARQLRLLLQVKAASRRLPNPEAAARDLKLHPYYYKKLLTQSRNFSREQLIGGLELVLATDLALKNGAEPQVSLETLISRL